MDQAVTVDVLNASGARDVPREGEIRAWLRHALQKLPDVEQTCEVSVRIVDEKEGREINKRYRNIDKPTNVLSFPADGRDGFALPQDTPRVLGDIVICAPVVEREASAQDKALDGHWEHLLVHGLLHLLGYDHESAEEARAMESLEVAILADHGIADPYR